VPLSASKQSNAITRIEFAHTGNDQYLAVFDLLPKSVWIFETATLRIVAVNQAAIDAYGYSRQEFLTMTIADIRPQEDVQRLKDHIRDETNSLDYAGVWRHRRKDGSLFAVEITTQAMNFNGVPCELVVADDVSVRQLESQRLRLAIDAAQLGVWEVTLPERRLIWDQTCGELFGRQPDQYPKNAQEFQLCVHPDDRHLVKSSIQQTLLHGTDYRCEFRIVLPDGQVRWHSVFGRRILSLDGVPCRIIGVCSDATRRRELEQQLNQSLKMEAIGRLAGGIAHDFNNLLTVINGHAELLLNQLASDSLIRRPISEIRRAAKRGASLTFKLLAFSRNDEIVNEVLDLNRIVRESRSLLSRMIGDACQIQIRYQTAAAMVVADRTHMDQVILNLCINARDASTDGGTIRITIDTVSQPADSGTSSDEGSSRRFVTLTVSDNGCGIAESDKRHIFEPFFTTKELGKGTGLGLSIVHGIVQQCGGFIEVQSEVGHGTSFTVFLPAAQAESC
jgi:PAS domain S-box-containing protein